MSSKEHEDKDSSSNDGNNSYAESVQSFEAHNAEDPEQMGATSQLSRHISQMLSNEDGVERLASMARVLSTKTKKEMDKFEVDTLDFDLRALLNYLRSHQLSQGIEPGDSGVAFKNLTAVGVDASAAFGPSVEEMLRNLVTAPAHMSRLFGKKDDVPLRNIIQNCSGVVESGEMLFVVGRPGAGCSTLLKCVSGETSELVEVNGEFSYDGLEQHEMMSNY